MMQPPLQSSHQLALFQVENQVDQYLQYTMVEQANAIARILAKRKLPMFYFTEAGEELGITAKTCRTWKMNAWPVANRPNDDKLMYKTAIYIRVHLRLSAYPENETHAEATLRLRRRIQELEDRDFSRNQIAQQLRMAFRTLKELCNRTENQENAKRSNHCPWKLLERLENAEEEITRQRERQVEFQDLRVIHDGADYREAEEDPGLLHVQDTIQVGGQCRKCDARWPNLREDGTDNWKRPIMVCMSCGTENSLSLESEDPEGIDLETPGQQEFIERYAPCRHCQAYWNHMKWDRNDRWNNGVYICLRCATINRVPQRRQRANTF